MTANRSVMLPIGDEWVVTMEWPEGVENGGPHSLVIQPVGGCPPGGLSSTVLRQINFQQAIDRLREGIAHEQKRNRQRAKMQAVYEKHRAERLRAALGDGVTDEYLALLASAYVSAVNRGQDKPNDHLAEMVGKTTNTVRGHLWQARKQGFLTGSHGRAGGQLTPKATGILERIVPDVPVSLAQMAENAKSGSGT
jgi:hypothetical protein